MQNKKIGFFARIKKSIFKFDEYEKFLEEPLGKAFKYFFKLMLVFSLLVTVALTYKLGIAVNKVIYAFESEFPNFTIKDGVLDIEEKDKIEYYLEDYNLKFVMDETVENYTENDYENSVIMLKNSMFIKADGYTQEIGYNNIEDISKQTIVELLHAKELITFYIIMLLVMLVLDFIAYSIIILLDVVTLSILGLIINLFIGTKFKYKDIVKLSIYAMTLPILLYMLYIVANIIFGTTIKVFELAYNTISYIYLITVMLMIKSEVIKNTQELQKVIEEQKKVKEELEREKQEEKERQEKKKQEEKEKKEKGEEKTPKEPQPDNG